MSMKLVTQRLWEDYLVKDISSKDGGLVDKLVYNVLLNIENGTSFYLTRIMITEEITRGANEITGR